jgi:hypothetical protein
MEFNSKWWRLPPAIVIAFVVALRVNQLPVVPEESVTITIMPGGGLNFFATAAIFVAMFVMTMRLFVHIFDADDSPWKEMTRYEAAKHLAEGEGK